METIEGNHIDNRQEILYTDDTPSRDFSINLGDWNRYSRNCLCCCAGAGPHIVIYNWMLSYRAVHVAW